MDTHAAVKRLRQCPSPARSPPRLNGCSEGVSVLFCTLIIVPLAGLGHATRGHTLLEAACELASMLPLQPRDNSILSYSYLSKRLTCMFHEASPLTP